MNYAVKLMKTLVDIMDRLEFEPANGACGYRGFRSKVKHPRYGYTFVPFDDVCYALANWDSPRVSKWYNHVFLYWLNDRAKQLVRVEEAVDVRNLPRLQLNGRKHDSRFIWVNDWQGKSHKINLTELEKAMKEMK